MSQEQTYDYTILELFEEAKKDTSWEEDPAMRERLSNELLFFLIQALS